MSLVAESISYRYPQPGAVASALDEVSIRSEQGELVLVLGETGSGKSTLMRLLSGLMTPDSGSVSIDGRPMNLNDSLGQVGLVFQDAESQLFADTLVADVAFGPRNLGLSSAQARLRAEEALGMVGLDAGAFGDRSPFTLSGGEARRAAIAGVIAMQPKYLLADEPTAGLDASGRQLIRDLLLYLKSQCGVVVVSHTAEEFLEHADRVVVLNAGTVAWSGDSQQLVDAPELFEEFGLLAPEVLQVQQMAARAGQYEGPFSLDPLVAASGFRQPGDN